MLMNLTTEDVLTLKRAAAKQIKSERIAWITALVLSAFCWGIYFILMTDELLGYSIMGTISGGTILGVVLYRGRALKSDLKQQQKEIIEGILEDKTSTQFKYTTQYQFLVGDVKINVDQSNYVRFDISQKIRVERTPGANVILGVYSV